jgi:ADP-heptose:LPS heptosyltransferase
MNRLNEKIRQAAWASRALLQHGWPRALIHFAAGVGDELMLTAVIRELRQRGSPQFWVMSQRPELFGHNPDVAAVVPVDPRFLALARRCGATIVEPCYTVADAHMNLLPPPAHIITCLMATAGITGPITLHPSLNLTAAEKTAAAEWAGVIVLQPTVRSAARPTELKEWWPERWQLVVDALRSRHRIVQVGGAADPLLNGVEDQRGKRNLRQLAAMLFQARLFVGLESGLMHLARAVDCPAVIVYGGRTHPHQTGYAAFTNLFTSPMCAPCWRYNGCEFDRICMSALTPETVLAALQRVLSVPRFLAPPTIVELTASEQQRIAAALGRTPEMKLP